MLDEQKTKMLTLLSGPLIAIFTGVWLSVDGHTFAIAFTAAITVLCATWWIFEPIPIPATSIIPLALFPLCGVLDNTQVAEAYGSPLILLLLGGFILSTAMEKSGAHRRIALGMIHLCGAHSSRRVVIGFMSAAALLSMWISNTATTLMLLPVALAVLDNAKDKKLQAPLLLGICYAASLGGMGTPIGTPPNVIFMKIYHDYTQTSISFTDWMRLGVPVIVLFLPLMMWWLTRNLRGEQAINIPSVGRWRPSEIRVLLVFGLTALAWITREEPMGGWSTLFNLPGANDAAVALSAVVLMFILPDGQGGRLLDWESANKIPWGTLLLFAGGIAIANAFMASGLSQLLGDQLSSLSHLPVFILILCICIAVTFMTEVTSNTATASLLMPILAVAGTAIGVDPALLMVPAAMSASCAFMLPVATGPNAIIFGSNRVPIKTMAKNGFALNWIGALIIAVCCYVLLA